MTKYNVTIAGTSPVKNVEASSPSAAVAEALRFRSVGEGEHIFKVTKVEQPVEFGDHIQFAGGNQYVVVPTKMVHPGVVVLVSLKDGNQYEYKRADLDSFVGDGIVTIVRRAVAK